MRLVSLRPKNLEPCLWRLTLLCSEVHIEGLGGDDEHLAESGAELVVGLILPLVLRLVQIARQLDQAVRHVGLHDAGQGRGVLEDDGPRLKLGDVVADVHAVLHEVRDALNDHTELLDASEPLTVPKILKSLDGLLALVGAVADASLDLSEALLLEHTLEEADEHRVVLVGGQLADGLGINSLDSVHCLHVLLHRSHHEVSVHFSLLSQNSYLIISKARNPN
mmetsp:Transcript_19539/g.23162  ORF Transcript_19539/g.23162 Transcript_19539/m.23162 type:complete len:222 (-) Transcript_19539:4-669(-)